MYQIPGGWGGGTLKGSWDHTTFPWGNDYTESMAGIIVV